MSMKRWQATEKQTCKVLGKRHIGGPGAPDCSDGSTVVEVKHQRRPVNKTQMREIADKPWVKDRPLIVAVTSGFTPGARRLAGRLGVSMYKVYPDSNSSRRINPPRSG